MKEGACGWWRLGSCSVQGSRPSAPGRGLGDQEGPRGWCFLPGPGFLKGCRSELPLGSGRAGAGVHRASVTEGLVRCGLDSVASPA